MLDIKNTDRDWLEDAISLNAYRSKSRRLKSLVNNLFDEIAPLIKVSSRSRQKDALKTILINLSVAHNLDKPVRYSRDRNRYTRDRRYGQLHFKYDRLIPIIDALERLGYIEQSSFYFGHDDDDDGRQTRMWATDKLWSDYNLSRPGFFQCEPAGGGESIILRNELKQEIGYRETTLTHQMREDLDRCNAFIRKRKITLRLVGSTIVDNRFLVEDIYRHIQDGKVWIKKVQFSQGSPLARTIPVPLSNYTKHMKEFIQNPTRTINNILDIITDPITITQMKRRIAFLRVYLRRNWSDEHRFERYLGDRSYEIHLIPWKERLELLAADFTLRDIGVEMLEIKLEHEQLHRIFNRKSFKLGGRAYGALHQDWVRREMRQHILIDGVPTIEIDFSAFHILMLYHRKGIDYQHDPYLVCEGPEMRKTYKAVGLIAINAENERKAYGAIRDELKDQGLPLPQRKEPLISLVRRFKETHQPIAEYLFSDVGIELQNIDGNIMNAILVRLMDHGVLGLSVYDSVVVQQQHEDLLRGIMIEEYRRVMGFEPRF